VQVGAAGEQVIVDAQGRVLHSHDGLKPHFHEPIYSPGEFRNRPRPLPRTDFHKRSFTIGIGGPVGTGCVREPPHRSLVRCLHTSVRLTVVCSEPALRHSRCVERALTPGCGGGCD